MSATAGGGMGATPAASGASGSGGTLSVTGGASGSGATGGLGGSRPGAPPYLSPESGLSSPTRVPPDSPASCSAPNDVGPFCDQMVWNAAPAHRVLYSWTTAEQAEELRRDRILLTRTETPGLGRGYAFTSIDELAARGDAPENQLLAKLSSELFVKARYAWPNPWATRMGWPGEDYGEKLLKIVLKPEAWILVVSDGEGIAVIDLDNNLVPIADAVAHSERVGAVYFYKKDITGNGSFFTCSGGYREFIIGNEAMVEEWSLETEEIRARLAADVELLSDFLDIVREMPDRGLDPETFNGAVVCSWDDAASTPVEGYLRALSIPSEYYMPLPAELAALGDTLTASLFDPDPLRVMPGK